MNRKVKFLPAFTVILPLLASAAGDLELTLGYDYTRGDYGQDVTTEIEYMPLTLDYYNGPWRMELTVPYIRVTGNGTVVPGAGGPMVFSDFDSGVFGPGGMRGGGNSGSRTDTVTNSGLGDVMARVGYSIFPGADAGSFYELSGRVKFGTADEDDGLGTGENDYALQLDGIVGSGTVAPYFTLGYLVTGDSNDFEYKDVPYGSVGLMFRRGDSGSAGIGYDYRRAAVSGSDDQQQASAYLGWVFSPRWSGTLSGLFGLTDSTPDYGASFMLTGGF